MKIKNPVLPGFHADPSMVRVGDTYYIAIRPPNGSPVCAFMIEGFSSLEVAAVAAVDDDAPRHEGQSVFRWHLGT